MLYVRHILYNILFDPISHVILTLVPTCNVINVITMLYIMLFNDRCLVALTPLFMFYVLYYILCYLMVKTISH